MTSKQQSTLGIIAGSGRLPTQLVEACRSINRPHFVLTFEEGVNIDAVEHAPHAIVRLGAVGTALKELRNAEVKEIVLAGRVSRPSLSGLRPDFTATKLLARLGSAFLSGDDALLKALMKYLEDEGFRVVGAHNVMQELLATEGVYGKIKPDAQDEKDIQQGITAAKQLGALDIGQAVIIENGYVLGVEAAEGTDELISRCVNLKREKNAGVLIKAKKPNQDERADLPSIGVDTIDRLHKAGLKGIAIEAAGSLIVDREETVARADSLGLFITGIRNE